MDSIRTWLRFSTRLIEESPHSTVSVTVTACCTQLDVAVMGMEYVPGGVDPPFCDTKPVPPIEDVQLVTALMSASRSAASIMILRLFRKPNGKRIRAQSSGIPKPVLFLFIRAVVELVVIFTVTLPELPEATMELAGLKMQAAS